MKTALIAKKPQPDPELPVLKAELLAAQGELAFAYQQFDQALAPELVECCIYQISAAKARCDYLIRVIKERTPQPAAFAGVPAVGRRDAPLPNGSEHRGGDGNNEEDALWT